MMTLIRVILKPVSGFISFKKKKKITWIYVNIKLLLIRKLYTIIRVTTTF
jgi:hypothetical protein